ncbi:hypothetical protein BSKO_13661 [Bryopsis sp. KO-2023]|nr:hypothetical protein BSKO_13661 [Bryopsis sp. KO-2023]
MDPRDEKIAQLEQENRVLKEELRSAQQKLAIIQSIVNATGVSETVEETEVDEFAVPETVEETEVDGFAATEIESGGGGGAPSGETGSDNGGGPNVETEHTTPSGSGQAAGQQRSTFEQEALPPSSTGLLDQPPLPPELNQSPLPIGLNQPPPTAGLLSQPPPRPNPLNRRRGTRIKGPFPQSRQHGSSNGGEGQGLERSLSHRTYEDQFLITTDHATSVI